MKRINPVSEQTEAGYPTPETWGTSRRGFLRVTLGSACAVGAGVALSGVLHDAAEARPRRKRYHSMWFRLRRSFRFQGCDLKATELYVQSPNRALITFMSQANERDGIEAAIHQVLSATRCSAVKDRKRLARLEQRLARALRSYYRKRTRKFTSQAIVTLTIVRQRQYRPLPGTPPPPRYPRRP